jgi:hypothetical protein
MLLKLKQNQVKLMISFKMLGQAKLIEENDSDGK